MKTWTILIPVCLGLVASGPVPASAGCIKSGAVGAVVGHLAGHHGAAGAAVGCAVGAAKKHGAKKQKAQQAQQAQTQQGKH